jgi:hypothetical protein
MPCSDMAATMLRTADLPPWQVLHKVRISGLLESRHSG